MANKPSPAMQRAAERAAEQPFFLAGALRAYATAYSLNDEALAAMLGCAVDDLPRLALCRRPHDRGFRTDVEHLAARFGLHAHQLAHLVREVDALAAIGQQAAQPHHLPHTQQAPRMLRAARDRDEADDETESTEDA